MAFFLQLIALTAVGTAAWNPSQEPNMNGDYVLSKTPGAPAGKDFPTNYKDYPGAFPHYFSCFVFVFVCLVFVCVFVCLVFFCVIVG